MYNSASFYMAAYYHHERKVMCHRVTQNSGRGILDSVLQEELQNLTAQHTVRVTGVKASSVCHHTKPIHYLRMVSESIEWVEKEKKVYNADTNKVESLELLQLNQIEMYNNVMGNVDVADHLRDVYIMNVWARNRKW